jgi:hypothetical protein
VPSRMGGSVGSARSVADHIPERCEEAAGCASSPRGAKRRGGLRRSLVHAPAVHCAGAP